MTHRREPDLTWLAEAILDEILKETEESNEKKTDE